MNWSVCFTQACKSQIFTAVNCYCAIHHVMLGLTVFHESVWAIPCAFLLSWKADKADRLGYTVFVTETNLFNAIVVGMKGVTINELTENIDTLWPGLTSLCDTSLLTVRDKLSVTHNSQFKYCTCEEHLYGNLTSIWALINVINGSLLGVLSAGDGCRDSQRWVQRSVALSSNLLWWAKWTL